MKTTLYIPDDLKRALEEAARSRGSSEAEVVREALQDYFASSEPPKPRIPLFRSKHPGLSEKVDEALSGFGER